MNIPMLYPDEHETVHRHSSIDQFRGYLSTYRKGGWAPIVFDQLDGIDCEGTHTHPVIISMDDEIGYVFPEAHCVYASDHFIYLDKEGVEQKLLPECFGGGGEFYDSFVKSNSFVSFDDGSSLGVHQNKTLRAGLSYVLADETLPAVE